MKEKRSKNRERAKPSQKQWDLIIQPKRRWLDIHFREIYYYRDLIFLFVKRDFVTIYKQTILGPLWFILQPLFTTVVFTFLFSGLAKIPTDGIPQTLFYYGGTMLWGYFSACLLNVADSFTANSNLFAKVYFPRIVAPVSKIFSNLISSAIQLGTLIAFYIYFVATGSSVRPTWWVFTLPLIFAQLACLGTGFGMIISALTTKYRDLRQLVGFGVQLWMYATPIAYPYSQVPEKFRWVFAVNPLTAPIEGFRAACYNVGGTSPLMLIESIAVTIVFLVLGLILFNRTERTFIDVI